MQRDTPLDPLPFAGGSVLLLPEGKCIVQLDPLPVDAPDIARKYVNRYQPSYARLGDLTR